MSQMAPDRVAMLAGRLQQRLSRWSETLPSEGRKGTPTELAASLEAVTSHGDHMFRPLDWQPAGSGAEFVASGSWNLCSPSPFGLTLAADRLTD
jgi:hypothetical protein